MARAARFAVNILAGDQTELAFHFAGKAENRFDGARWEAHPDGAPILPGVSAWLDCAVHDRVAAGAHDILISAACSASGSTRARRWPIAAACSFAVDQEERAHG
jgi:flavin reductase (DIM6/NTAB) family NADH-FMN oxidoreductase RutF